MLFFFFFCLFRVCQSEWPPFMCEKEVAIRKNRVILTSSTQQQREYSCQMQETFTNATFIEFERKYGQQRFQEVHDSIMGFSITSKKRHLFNIQIHNDHIESDASQRKCYDIFTSKRIWMKIQLHPLPELRKTFVSVHISHNNVYSPCFNFELNTIIEEFSMKMHAITDSGMQQSVLAVSTHPRVDTVLKNVELATVKKRLAVVEKGMEDILDGLRENREWVHAKHDEIQTSVKRSLKHTHTTTSQKVYTHSFGVISLLVMFTIGLCAFVKYNTYTTKRMEHIL